MAVKHIHMVGVKKKRGKGLKSKAKSNKMKVGGGHSTRAHRAGKTTPVIKKGKWA